MTADPQQVLRAATQPASRRMLRAGLRVLQRERDVVQVGLDPVGAVRFTATPGVRRTLRALTGGGSPDECEPGVVDRLERLGLLAAPTSATTPGAAEVVVRTFGQPLPALLVDALAGAGLDLPQDETKRLGHVDPTGAEVLLLVGVGEPHRDLLDPLVAAGRSHLLLRFSEGEAVLGPYVVPGVTACLRCVDAHHTDRDPRWPLLVEQQADQTTRRRADGSADPVDPLLARLAVSWAALDLGSASTPTGTPSETQTDRPATWSTTIRLPPALAGFEAVSWLRHPGCGCSLGAPTPAALPR